MHNKGQVQNLGFALLIAAMLFFAGSLFVAPLEDSVTTARADLNCTGAGAATISDGNKVTCLVVDAIIPWFLLAVFSIIGGLIASRFLI